MKVASVFAFARTPLVRERWVPIELNLGTFTLAFAKLTSVNPNAHTRFQPSTMVTGTAAPETPWLTELDSVELSWNTTAFSRSHLGRLPIELLQTIIRYIPTTHLPAVARVTPRLRELAERSLYRCIDLSRKILVDCGDRTDVLWLLHCTLIRRPDLARMIKQFSGTVYEQDTSVEVNTSILFPGDVHFSSAAKVSLSRTVIKGRILLQHLTNVEKVRLTLNVADGTDRPWETALRKQLALKPLHKLLPGFNNMTAHGLKFPGLQKLTGLEFAGSEFHWVLAKLPCLEKLKLTRPCLILPDAAPNEVNTNLKSLGMSARSTILRDNSQHHATLKAFLAHFPSLEDLRLTIYDLRIDATSVSSLDLIEEGESSYSNLLERISSVAAHLVTLDVGVYKDDEDDENDGSCDFLDDVQPASGFQQFKSLKRLVVPYQCLLGHTTSSVDTLPSPAAILPPALENSEVHCPQIYIYKWLARLRIVRDRLPVLSEVHLYCQSPYGDDYDIFHFVNCHHSVPGVLGELGITLHKSYRPQDWQKGWDEYDIDIFNVIRWLESLGA